MGTAGGSGGGGGDPIVESSVSLDVSSNVSEDNVSSTLASLLKLRNILGEDDKLKAETIYSQKDRSLF